MKLSDLARTSSDSKSFVSALWTIWSRFRSPELAGKTGEAAGETGEATGETGETAKVSRKSYESVPRLSSAPRLQLTLLQQKTMVPVLDILHPPRHPGFLNRFPTRADRGDHSFHPRTCHRPPSCIS